MAITTYTRNFTALTQTTLAPYTDVNLTTAFPSLSAGGNNQYSKIGLFTGIDSPIPTAFGQIVRVTFRLTIQTSTGVDSASYIWYNGNAISAVSSSVTASPGTSTKDMTGIVSPWYNNGQPVNGLSLDMVNNSTFGIGVGFYKSSNWTLGTTSSPIVIIEVDDAFSINRRAIFTTKAESTAY